MPSFNTTPTPHDSSDFTRGIVEGARNPQSHRSNKIAVEGPCKQPELRIVLQPMPARELVGETAPSLLIHKVVSDVYDKRKRMRHRQAMVSQTQESLKAYCAECHAKLPKADFLIRVSLGGTGTKREKAKRTFRSPAGTGRRWSSGSIAAGFTQERPAGSAFDHPTLSKVREFNPMAASDHA